MKVKSVKHLIKLSLERKSVSGGNIHRRPAAFIVSMQARYVQGLIDQGLWVYKPRGRNKAKATSAKPTAKADYWECPF